MALPNHSLKRPTSKDEAVLDLVAYTLAGMVDPSCRPADATAEDMVDHMFDALLQTTLFSQVFYLHELGWKISDDVMDLMRRSASMLNKAVDVAVSAWVLENAVRFPAKVGDKVKFNDPDTGFEKSGPVMAIMNVSAKALVRVITFNSGEKAYSDIWVPAERVRGVISENGAFCPVKAVRGTVGASNNATEGDITNLLPFYRPGASVEAVG